MIPSVQRQSNGYRVFTDFHIAAFKLARTALKVEVLQNGLRKKIIEMVKVAALGDFDKAMNITNEYLEDVRKEQKNAEEAIKIVNCLLAGKHDRHMDIFRMKRKEVSEYLQISIDTLRNWEMNGLLSVKRTEKGYRIYTNEDINRLKVIRSLRCANYSLEAILRMLKALSHNPQANIKNILNTPQETEDIISVCDKLITSLQDAERNAKSMMGQLKDMKNKF